MYETKIDYNSILVINALGHVTLYPAKGSVGNHCPPVHFLESFTTVLADLERF